MVLQQIACAASSKGKALCVHDAMGEGIAVDAAGNVFTAEAQLLGVTKYVRDRLPIFQVKTCAFGKADSSID